jgi:hypothetical protein
MPTTPATTIRTLDALLVVLTEHPDSLATASTFGLPTADGAIDWASLPTFGGEEPQDTGEVWSWDATRVMLGAGGGDVYLADRRDLTMRHFEVDADVETGEWDMRTLRETIPVTPRVCDTQPDPDNAHTYAIRFDTQFVEAAARFGVTLTSPPCACGCMPTTDCVLTAHYVV